MIANHRRPGRARLGPVLVSVVIVLICAGVLIPAVSHLRQTARSMSCQSNIKHIGLAVLNYPDYPDSNGNLPTAVVPNADLPLDRRQSWMVLLASFLEGENPNSRINQNILFNCRGESPPTAFMTSYLGISGVGANAATYPLDHPDAGIFGYDRTVKISDIKNTSSTLMILETNTGGPWVQGGHSTVRGIEAMIEFGATTPFGSTHRSGGLFSSNVGANACMADGSVHWFAHTIDPNILMMLARIRGEKNLALE
jgi:hypothetical protein